MAAKLQFKFREDTTLDDRQQLIAKLEDGGADRIEAVFPDSEDDELAALYSAVIGDDRQYRKLLQLLRRSSEVEFAQPESGRRLILPVELKERASRSRSGRS